MAGTIPGFNADEVRNGVRLAMSVGLPPEVSDQPIFYFPAPSTKDPSTDGQGTPLGWDDPRVIATPAKDPVRVACAIETIDDTGEVTGFGVMSSTRLMLTFLDQDYALIEGFSYVVVGGNAYHYQKTLPPLGLDVVGVWQVQVRTEDEA